MPKPLNFITPMQIKKDIADLKEYIKGIEPEVVDFMDSKARAAVAQQQVKSDYLNHTWNLRSAVGYVVNYKGKEKRRFIGTQNHPDPRAYTATTKLLNEVNKAGSNIIFADGMYYASFVSSKGYDVLDTAKLYLHRTLNGKE